MARCARAVVVAAVCLGAAIARAQWLDPAKNGVVHAQEEGLANFDIRFNADGTPALGTQAALARRGADAARRAGLERLRGRVELVRVDEDPVLGTARFVRSWTRMLTAAKPGGAPTAVVRDFVSEYADLLGIDGAEVDGARTTRDYTTDHNGATHLTLQQQSGGVDIYGAGIKANVARDGRLINFSSTMLTRPLGGFAAPEWKLSDLEAIRAGAASVGVAVRTDPTPAEEAKGPSRKRSWNNGPDFRADRAITTERVLFPLTVEELRPAWCVLVPTVGVGHTYELVIDAIDGRVLHRTNELCFETSTFRVYTLRSPTPGPGRATNDGFRYPYASRELVGVDAAALGTASPFGWFDTNGVAGPEYTDTRGNNVDAHLDVDANNAADPGGRADGGVARLFDFPQDNGSDPVNSRMAAVAQAFYWGNKYHDWLYALGFNEVAGNFQVNNYGRGGAGNDAVQLDCQDGSGTNNANFGTPVDGSAPRCQMYLWTTTPRRDGDLDAEVIFHEFTHGLSNRLTGGPANSGALGSTQSGGMGEGWSDFFACCLLSAEGEDPNAPVAFGAYTSNNYYRGIRRYPYCTDTAKNPLTFDAFGTTGTTSYGTTRSTEVHNTGEIWAMTLWECRAALFPVHGFGANQLIMQLAVDGMKLQPANPSFSDARDAILQADLVNNGGVNQLMLWRAFAKRGLGYSFSTPGATSTATPTLGTDLPPYAENADAGDVPASARVVLGNGSVTRISGTLAASNADMYRISICDRASFSATTVGGAGFDTQLFLFDVNGMPVEFNDDSSGTSQSTLTNQFVPANGDYYLAISAADRDPVSVTGEIWLDAPTTTQRAPDGPGAGVPIEGWTGTGDPGATPGYTITLTGACAASAGQVAQAALPLSGFGSPVPGALIVPSTGQTVVFQTYVVAGTLPASTGITVQVNGAAVGMGTVTLADNGVSPDATAGDRIYSASRTMGNYPVGTYDLPYSGSDAQGRTFGGTMQLVVSNPIGTCCLPGSVCVVQAALDCSTAGGQFKGSLYGCDIRPCVARAEVEPNGTSATANSEDGNFLPYAGNLYHMGMTGEITAGTDHDFFEIGALQVGDVLTVSQAGSNAGAGTCTDTRVWLFRSGSANSVTNNDDGGPGTDSLVYRFTVTAADTYIVEATGFATTATGTTTNTGTYRLGIFLENAGTAPGTGGTFTAESEPNDSTTTANGASSAWRQVRYINTVSGSIAAGDTDMYSYHFTAGDVVSTRVVSTSGLDAKSALLDSTGANLILENGGSTGPNQDSPIYGYVIPTTGTYLLSVGAGAGTGSYLAVVYLSTATPPALACAADFNRSGAVSVQDIFDFLNAWFAGDPRADVNGSGGVEVQDIFDFLNTWFAGC